MIIREIDIDKLRVGWNVRAKRFKDRIRSRSREGSIVKQYWKEKEEGGWKDVYRVERSRCYVRNGWEVEENGNREGGYTVKRS